MQPIILFGYSLYLKASSNKDWPEVRVVLILNGLGESLAPETIRTLSDSLESWDNQDRLQRLIYQTFEDPDTTEQFHWLRPSPYIDGSTVAIRVVYGPPQVVQAYLSQSVRRLMQSK